MPDIIQKKKLQKPGNVQNPASPRQPWDEVDPSTGEAYGDIPGVEHDEVSGALMEAPAQMALGPAKAIGAGEGFISRMIAKGAPKAAGTAEELGTQGINTALSQASQRTRELIEKSPSLMERLRTEGTRVIDELEGRIVSQTRGQAGALIGKKLEGQRITPKSNPAPNEEGYNYAELNKPQQKTGSGRVIDYSSGVARMRLRRPGEED